MTTIATGDFLLTMTLLGFFKNSNIEIVASIFIILEVYLLFPTLNLLKEISFFSRCSDKWLNIFVNYLNNRNVFLFSVYKL